MNPLRHLRNRKVLAVVGFVAFLAGVLALWPQSVAVDLAVVDAGPAPRHGRGGGRDAGAGSLPGLGAGRRPGPAHCPRARRRCRRRRDAPRHIPAGRPQPARRPQPRGGGRRQWPRRVRRSGGPSAEESACRSRPQPRPLGARGGTRSSSSSASCRNGPGTPRRDGGPGGARGPPLPRRFAMASAEHRLEMAQARLLQASGRARAAVPSRSARPSTGSSSSATRWSEAVVPAGEPLMELGDPRQLEIVSDLLSTDAVRVHSGDTVLIEQWGGDETLGGSRANSSSPRAS